MLPLSKHTVLRFYTFKHDIYYIDCHNSMFESNVEHSIYLNEAAYHDHERSSQAAKQLASVARKMVMREIPHCCQDDDLQFC